MYFQPTSLRGGQKYYIQWSMQGSIASGPWQPAISVNGMSVTGNAEQFTANGYQAMDGGGTGFAQGAPFEIFYRINTSSVDEQKLGLAQVKIYPNPAREEAKIGWYSEKRQDVSITITDITGKAVVRLPLQTFDPGSQQVALPLGELNSGMYLVKLQTPTGNTHQKLQIIK